MSRLRPLAELYLDHLDLIGGGLLRESAGIELAVGGPAAEIATAQFPDQVAAMFTVVAADAALARVMVGVITKSHQDFTVMSRFCYDFLTRSAYIFLWKRHGRPKRS